MSALLEGFASAFETLPARDAGGLGAARRGALEAALRDGLPGPRSERWKYTSLRAFARRAFVPAAAQPAAYDTTLLDAIPAPRIVFVNGRHDPAGSDLSGLPEGVSLQPLSRVLAEGTPREVNFLGRSFEHPDEVFARLNAALADEGVVLRAQEGAICAAPVHLVFIGTPADADRAWHARHLVQLRRGAQLAVVEHHLAAGAHAHLGNALMHVHLTQDARLVHARVQDESPQASLFARTDAVLARDALYRRVDLELGAALSRHELNVRLEGEGARFASGGVLFGTGRRHLDTRLGIEHIARDTACDLSWRGLGAGRSRVVFHGGITIRAGADGSDANLSNKNLLLDTDAEIDTQPVLEIHADEVKAAHGATVGQLDPTAMFYLRSRGLPEADARRVLTAAFCREALRSIPASGHDDALQLALDAALGRLEVA